MRGLNEVLSFEKTNGTVTGYTPPDKNAEKDLVAGEIRYEYSVAGQKYQGRYPPTYDISMPRAPYAVLSRPWNVGEPVTVYYSSTVHNASTLEPRVEPIAFIFLTVAALTLVIFSPGLFGNPEKMQEQTIGGGVTMPGGSILPLVYIVLSVLGIIGIIVAANYANWRTAAIVGVLTPTLLIPTSAWLLIRWTQPTSSRRTSDGRGADATGDSGRRKRIAIYALVLACWWAFLGVFLYQVLGGVLQALDAQRRYLVVSGEIIESRLKEIPSTDRKGPTYRPVVVYRYTLDGVAYRSDRIYCAPMAESCGKDAAEMIRSRYPDRSPTTVYYDPRDPQRSLLDTGFFEYRAFELFFLFPFVVIGVYLLPMTLIRQIRGKSMAWPTDSAREAWVGHTFRTWFVAQIVSTFAIGFAGTFRPDRAWLVWPAAGVVAAAVLIAAVIFRPRQAAANRAEAAK